MKDYYTTIDRRGNSTLHMELDRNHTQLVCPNEYHANRVVSLDRPNHPFVAGIRDKRACLMVDIVFCGPTVTKLDMHTLDDIHNVTRLVVSVLVAVISRFHPDLAYTGSVDTRIKAPHLRVAHCATNEHTLFDIADRLAML